MQLSYNEFEHVVKMNTFMSNHITETLNEHMSELVRRISKMLKWILSKATGLFIWRMERMLNATAVRGQTIK